MSLQRAVTNEIDHDVDEKIDATRKKVVVTIISGFDDYIKVAAIRSAVYLSNPGESFDNHFDKNDYCSCVLLATVGGEPAGTMRCRWYSGFARFEKLAIRSEFRNFRVLNALVRAATRVSRSKGYSRVTGIALPEVVTFWTRKGGLTPGEPFETKYGVVVPLAGPIPEVDDMDPPLFEQAGDQAFEERLYEWEGNAL